MCDCGFVSEVLLVNRSISGSAAAKVASACNLHSGQDRAAAHYTQVCWDACAFRDVPYSQILGYGVCNCCILLQVLHPAAK